MSTVLHVDETGSLTIPPGVLPKAEPRTRYIASIEEGHLTLTPEQIARNSEPFWKQATPEEKIAALREWLKEAATPAALSDYAVSRDSIYD